MSDIQIISDFDNRLLQRRELSLRVPYTNKKTPKKEEAVQILSTFLKADSSLISLRRISPVFGKQESVINARVYEDANQLKKMETINKKLKKKAEAAPQQAAK